MRVCSINSTAVDSGGGGVRLKIIVYSLFLNILSIDDVRDLNDTLFKCIVLCLKRVDFCFKNRHPDGGLRLFLWRISEFKAAGARRRIVLGLPGGVRLNEPVMADLGTP